MKPLLEGLKALGAARLAALAGVGLAMLGLLALLVVRGSSPAHFSLLYADLDAREAGQITEALDRAHIAHQEPGAGDRILVPGDQVAQARMLLAKDGLPSGGSIGYEIFDRGDAMTASDFQQEINQTRALEGELARSIRMLNGVRAVRVHLVLPRHVPFAHDVEPAQASVILTMAGAARLDTQAVQSVLNLVAAAVPGLKPQAIALIDSRGTLLARAGQPTGEDQATTTAEELRRTTEAKISHAIEDMLERTVGPGHVRAEATVEMNYDHVNETTENYNPDQQVVRSTQSTTDKSRSTEADKPVTVQNNLPNADAGAAGGSGSTGDRNEETTNYEIGHTVRTLVREQPQIARISVAVMVDGTMAPGPNGKPLWQERSADELARLRRLVQSAVGFDQKRGDTVELVSMRFADTAEEAPLPSAGLLGLGLERSDLLTLGQSAIMGMVVLLALLFVVRPMAMRLTSGAERGETGEAAMLAGAAAGGRALSVPGSGGAGGAGATALLADESMVELANIEGQIKASSIRKIAELVEKHPDESLNIMRGWISQERG
ncbi:MAG: flagellar basal-body MS-ring/collar protein FliF [Rhodospirillales bacterium]